MSLVIPSLSSQIFHNPLSSYLYALGVFLGLLVIFRVAQWFLISRIEQISRQTSSELDDQLVPLLRSIHFIPFVIFALSVSLHTLNLAPIIATLTKILLITTLTYQGIIGLGILIDYSLAKLTAQSNNPSQLSALNLLARIAKIALWVIGVLLILQNFGVNITSLIAGLGIGGIAIGFALQNILEDVFSSFAIIFDKPFKVGDYIVTGKHSGIVEKIGIKTTRVRALQGEEIVIANKELTSARVQNYKKMQNRRISFSLGIAYDTPSKKLRALLKKINLIIEKQDNAEFDRAHFNQFGDSALIFQIVYHLTSSDYTVYMDTHQEILFSLKEYCESHQIEFAYPTQTVFIRK